MINWTLGASFSFCITELLTDGMNDFRFLLKLIFNDWIDGFFWHGVLFNFKKLFGWSIKFNLSWVVPLLLVEIFLFCSSTNFDEFNIILFSS